MLPRLLNNSVFTHIDRLVAPQYRFKPSLPGEFLVNLTRSLRGRGPGNWVCKSSSQSSIGLMAAFVAKGSLLPLRQHLNDPASHFAGGDVVFARDDQAVDDHVVDGGPGLANGSGGRHASTVDFGVPAA